MSVEGFSPKFPVGTTADQNIGEANDVSKTTNNTPIGVFSDEVENDAPVREEKSPLPDMPEPKPAELVTIKLTGDALNSISMAEVEADSYAIMAMMTSTMLERKQTARETRFASLNAQQKVIYSEADEMKKAGKDRFRGAMLSGGADLLGGLLQFGGGFITARQTGAASKSAMATKPAVDADKSALKAWTQGLATETQAARQWSEYGEGSSKMLSGAGHMVKAWKESNAVEHDAEQKKLEAVRKGHENANQVANDEMHSAQDFLRDIKDGLKATEQSRIEALRTINRNI